MTGIVNGEYRYFRQKVAGHSENTAHGALRRVAISFNSEQIDKLNHIAHERGFSFSKAVSDIVDAHLEQGDDA